MQTPTPAKTRSGKVTTIDLHQDLFDQLDAAAQAGGPTSKIKTVGADIIAMPFQEAAFDLISAKASVHSMSVDTLLAAWRSLLRPGNFRVLSELVLITEIPPEEVSASPQRSIHRGQDGRGGGGGRIDGPQLRRSGARAGHGLVGRLLSFIGSEADRYVRVPCGGRNHAGSHCGDYVMDWDLPPFRRQTRLPSFCRANRPPGARRQRLRRLRCRRPP